MSALTRFRSAVAARVPDRPCRLALAMASPRFLLGFSYVSPTFSNLGSGSLWMATARNVAARSVMLR